MSSIRSALDELVAEDLDRLTDQTLEADFAELEGAARTLQAERLRRLAEIDRRRSWARDGFLSSSAWLVVRFQMTWTAVTRMVREASGLERMPVTRRALTEGEISSCQVTLLVRACEAHPDEFDRTEGALVEAAATVSVGSCAGPWRTGGRHSTGRRRSRTPRRSSGGDTSTSPPRSTAWCASTATWTPRPGRCS